MNGEVRIVATLRLSPGANEQLTSLVAGVHETMRAKDPGTLAHNWYLSADGTECIVHEQYASSDAFLAHMANVSDQLGAILGLAQIGSVTVCGEVTAEARAVLDSFGSISYYSTVAAY